MIYFPTQLSNKVNVLWTNPNEFNKVEFAEQSVALNDSIMSYRIIAISFFAYPITTNTTYQDYNPNGIMTTVMFEPSNIKMGDVCAIGKHMAKAKNIYRMISTVDAKTLHFGQCYANSPTFGVFPQTANYIHNKMLIPVKIYGIR